MTKHRRFKTCSRKARPPTKHTYIHKGVHVQHIAQLLARVRGAPAAYARHHQPQRLEPVVVMRTGYESTRESAEPKAQHLITAEAALWKGPPPYEQKKSACQWGPCNHKTPNQTPIGRLVATQPLAGGVSIVLFVLQLWCIH